MLTNTERQQIVEEVNAGTYGIDEALDDIAAAQKGEEVRKALYAEALVLNREGHAGSTDMIARQQIANLQTSVNGQVSTLRTEVGEDIDDLETALNSGLATQNGKIAAQNATIAKVVANYNVEYGSTELWASTGETGALAAGTTVTLSEDVSHFDYIDIYSFCGNSNVLDTVPVDAKLQSSQGYALRWVNLSDPDSGSYKAYVRIIETRLHIIGTTLTIDHQVTYRNGEEVNISGAEITQSNRSTYMGELGIMKIVGRKITANTEIEDVRIGADGTEYASAGQAVRAQVEIVGDKLTNIKADLNRYQENTFRSPISYNITSNTWTVGQGINPTNGFGMLNAKYARTNYIRFSKPTLLYFDNSDYDFIVWEYSAQSVDNAEFAPRGYYGDEPVIISVEQGVTDFRVGVKRKDNADISAADITVLVAKLKTFILTDNTLTLSNVPADAKKTGDEIGALKEELSDVIDANSFAVLTSEGTFNDETYEGITFTWRKRGYCEVNGTASGIAFTNIYNDQSKLPLGLKAGNSYNVTCKSSNANLLLQIFTYAGSSTSTLLASTNENMAITIPADATGLLVRVRVLNGATVSDDTIKFDIYTTNLLTINANTYASLKNGTDYNLMFTIGVYKCDSIVSAQSMSNCPVTRAHVLYVFNAYSPTRYVQIVTSADGIYWRIYTGSWSSWIRLLGDTDNPLCISKTALPSCDLNTVNNVNMAYLLDSENTYEHMPDNSITSGVLQVFSSLNWTLQIFYTLATGRIFTRRINPQGVATEWAEASGDTPIQNVYNNTYNISTSPTITTDTNGWLQSVDTDTADETGKNDMTGAIMSMLTDTGYCHLGEGIFYVSGNIDMPEGSTLCGCGKKTVIRLLQSASSGYCVKIGKYCTIKDMSFEGARSFTMPSTKGTRNGVAFMANYDGNPSVTTEHCMMENVWFAYFSGAGIYCHNTSINYGKGLYVCNAFFHVCYAGIDIDYYSEFNRFVNICTNWCKYGCINNGGNNYFANSTFHATDIGFYVDGTQPNASHGVINGCEFVHIGSSNGIGIKMEHAYNGFIISNCSIGYCYSEFIDCTGIVFSGCQFIRGRVSDNKTMTITGGDTIMFNGCVFMITPVITINNNQKVKFDSCYDADGNAVSAS